MSPRRKVTSVQRSSPPVWAGASSGNMGQVNGFGLVTVAIPLCGCQTPCVSQSSSMRSKRRSQLSLRGPDIYDEGTVVREVYSVRALVRSGNSGGPLVSPQGRVLGVVFAASLSDTSTGYVLTAEQVAESARGGEQATERVSTGACA